jgi:peroxiredoxin
MHELALAGAPLIAGSWLSIKWWFAAKARRRGAPTSPLAFEHAPGADGRLYSMSSFRESTLMVVVFMSNRCPGVKAYDARLRALAEEFGGHGVQFVGVNPIDEALYPTESLREMAIAVRERNLPFPYLKDASQEMARRFGAACTPHTFVLDQARRIRYAGKIDDAFIPAKAGKHYLRDALSDLLAGKEPAISSTLPLGCAIEWSSRGSSSFSQPALGSAPHVTNH